MLARAPYYSSKDFQLVQPHVQPLNALMEGTISLAGKLVIKNSKSVCQTSPFPPEGLLGHCSLQFPNAQADGTQASLETM